LIPSNFTELTRSIWTVGNWRGGRCRIFDGGPITIYFWGGVGEPGRGWAHPSEVLGACPREKFWNLCQCRCKF